MLDFRPSVRGYLPTPNRSSGYEPESGRTLLERSYVIQDITATHNFLPSIYSAKICYVCLPIRR